MRRQDRRSAAAHERARIGARDGPIEIVEYDPSWPAFYIAECERLAPLLPGVRIHHIGSAAVPGLAGRGVIDVIALVTTSTPMPPLSGNGLAISYPHDST